MEQNQSKFSQYHFLAGGLFAFLALYALINTVQFLNYSWIGFSVFIQFFALICYIIAAILLFTNRRDWLACAGFGVLAFEKLCCLFIPYVSGKGTIFFSLIAYAATALFALAFFTDLLPQLKETALQFWFLPAVLVLALAFLNGFLLLLNWGFLFAVKSLFYSAIEAAALLFSAMWIVFPEGAPSLSSLGFGKTGTADSTGTENPDGSTAPKQPASMFISGYAGIPADAYCGLAKHILLLLFTFGIWNCIWIYKMTQHLNALPEEEQRSPVANLLLCIFVPFYNVYWTYKSAQRLDKLSARCGLSSDLAMLCLILAIFVSIVPPILMQDKLNTILASCSARPSSQSPAAAVSSAQDPAAHTPRTENTATEAHRIGDELREYKDLLDKGMITQEDYDAKKKQLLNL